MNNFKGVVRKNCSMLNPIGKTSFFHKQYHAVRAKGFKGPKQQTSQGSQGNVQAKEGLTKMPNKYMYIAKPNSEIGINRKKMRMLGVGHSLNDDFKSEKARARWSEFRRRMIYGSFAA